MLNCDVPGVFSGGSWWPLTECRVYCGHRVDRSPAPPVLSCIFGGILVKHHVMSYKVDRGPLFRRRLRPLSIHWGLSGQTLAVAEIGNRRLPFVSQHPRRIGSACHHKELTRTSGETTRNNSTKQNNQDSEPRPWTCQWPMSSSLDPCTCSLPLLL